eukprot:TRINITY_DN20911_c0_g3_i1.p1 TRINITY_DN20911_c0_g3~~TRINITY_DN20911_c0_g3_i1.p1  ORF type:complete len:423 (-),score=95.63 TRINITY_DN20911_c0_g3_i1:200-1468(-)
MEEVHPPWCADRPAVPAGAPPEPCAAGAAVSDAVQRGDVVSVKIDDKISFEIPKHLEFIKCLGRGTYGTVVAFRDTVAGRDVAIKKIMHPFRNSIDGKRCLREIKVLHMLDHECIIPLLDVLAPASPDFNEVYVVTELMDADLHTVITSELPLSDDHVQFFFYQILLALLYMHSANVVHRDLKPLNVLVNKNCDVKLCDFGLARGRAGFSQEDEDFLRTEYVGTRWYRAPEVVLTSMEYTAAVDLWGAGCILGELISRQPMFRGSDFLDQIRSICEKLGTPSSEELSFIPEQNEAARNFIKTRFPNFPKRSWVELFPSASDAQRDLLDKLLKFDPNSRITALESLKHPYLEEHYSEEDIPVGTKHVDWTFDDVPANELATLQRLIYGEMAKVHPEILDRDRDELNARGWSQHLVPSGAVEPR